MAAKTVLSEDRGPVRVLTMNRPERLNALNEALKDDMTEALQAAAADQGVGAVVLTGAGRAFCAGADLAGFAQMYQDGDRSRVAEFTELEFPRAFMEFPKPLIAAINGPAVGWGFTVSLACDLRLASSDAVLICGFVRVGVTPEFGSSHLLPRIIGLGRALELVLTARELGPEEARDWGLVSRVCAPQELVPAAVETARLIASYPAPALRLSKKILRHGSAATMEQTLGYEAGVFREAMATPEHYQAVQEMMAALAAKGK